MSLELSSPVEASRAISSCRISSSRIASSSTSVVTISAVNSEASVPLLTAMVCGSAASVMIPDSIATARESSTAVATNSSFVSIVGSVTSAIISGTSDISACFVS